MTATSAPIDPDERAIIHQLAILAAEEDASAAWLHTLRELVARGLPDDQFTEARLTALRTWKRDLGRRLARVRWQFDERRPTRLVQRDARRTRALAQQRIATMSDPPAQRAHAATVVTGSIDDVVVPTRDARALDHPVPGQPVGQVR